MAIIKKIVWDARCDKCRKMLSDGAMLPFVDSKKKLMEEMEEQLWEIKKGKVLCDECSFVPEEEKCDTPDKVLEELRKEIKEKGKKGKKE